jgi:hypothetical protein
LKTGDGGDNEGGGGNNDDDKEKRWKYFTYTEGVAICVHNSPILMDREHSFICLTLQINIKIEGPAIVICNLCATHAENIGHQARNVHIFSPSVYSRSRIIYTLRFLRRKLLIFAYLRHT